MQTFVQAERSLADPAHPAPRWLPFGMVSAGRAQRWHYAWLRELHFRLGAGPELPGACLSLHIRGLQPADLYELRASGHGARDFRLESYRDDCGRTVTAGEMLAAMFGQTAAGGMQVPAAEMRLAPVGLRGQVDVMVMVSTRASVNEIQVLAELHRHGADG